MFQNRKSIQSIMNGYSNKRGVTTSRALRKGVGSRDTNLAQDQNVQFCNRIGCSGRIKYGKQNTKIGSSEKAKSSKSSPNGNGVSEASSKSTIAREKTLYLDSKGMLSSQSGFDQSKSSQSGDSEATQSTSRHSGSAIKSGQNPVAKTGSVPSSVKSRKRIQHTSRSNKQNTQTPSAISSINKSSGIGTLNSSSNRSRCLENLKCNSVSDAVAPNCSSSGLKSPCKNVMKKRSLERECSESGRGRQAIAAAHVSSSSSSASISDSGHSSSTSGADSSISASARAGGLANGNKSRMRLSYRQNGRNTSSFRESSFRVPQFPDSEPPRHIGRPRLSQHYSANASSSGLSSFSLSSSNDDSRSTLMPYTSAESGYSHFINRDMLQRYNMDGIAEVLLALERIEQNEEMTHEQIIALETNLFLSGLNLYDQHRDMRLDIDDMSYEELLALGDRMGTVSTALSEKELSKCIKRSIYQVTPTEARFTESGEDGDDVKCSICQDEYVEGDGIGELVECEHAYHVSCINQWLRLKNWCPICKRAAAPSSSSLS